MEDLKHELIDFSGLARDDNGKGLVSLALPDSGAPGSGLSADRVEARSPHAALSGQHVRAAPRREPAAVVHPPEAERRQLTVMLCDLVGSTALSTRMDPEDLRDVITRFQDQCRQSIERYDGFIARYMGDGMLVYFGFPRAHENDAERAVRAGLDVVASMGALNADIGKTHGVVLAVRVGVATGPVVVGDLVGEGAAVVGETPNLAARLQGVAQPNQVVISAASHRIVSDLFTFDDLGTRELKGIAQPTEAWRVTGVRDTEGTRESSGHVSVSPLIGRQE